MSAQVTPTTASSVDLMSRNTSSGEEAMATWLVEISTVVAPHASPWNATRQSTKEIVTTTAEGPTIVFVHGAWADASDSASQFGPCASAGSRP